MASVVASYAGLAFYDNAAATAEDPYPATVTVSLATAPAVGDVVLVLFSTVGYAVQVDTDWRERVLDGGISGCGLSGWQRAFFYKSTSSSADEVYDDIGKPAASGGAGMSTYAYLTRATEAATAGTLTLDIAWTGSVPPTARSVSATVLVIRGLPDLGADLSYTLLPRYDYDPAHGVYGEKFIAAVSTDSAGDFPIAAADFGSSFQEGPWYVNPVNGRVGYPVLAGQVAVVVMLGDTHGALSAYDNVSAMTALTPVDLGECTAGATAAASVLVQYAAPTTTTYYGAGVDADDGGDGVVDALFLVLGPGSPEKAGLGVSTGITPIRGSRLSYHSLAAYAEVSLPPESVAGDLAVVIAADRYLPSFGAGWNTYLTRSGTNQSARVVWKVLTASDVAAGVVTYVLGGTGTGAAAVLTFPAGTFNPAAPFAGSVDSIASDIRGLMPYQVVGAGQSVVHYAHGRTTASGQAVSSEGTMLAARTKDADSISSLYVETATGDTTLSTTWDATVTTNGAFRFSFVIEAPGVVTVWGPQWSARAALMVAAFEAIPLSPANGEYVMESGPTLVVLADGFPSPFDVQFATSTSPDFSSTAWSVTIEDQVTGEVSAIVGVALPANTRSYWRARAGDGTSWGPWSAVQTLSYYPARHDAAEYMHNNVGALLDTVPDLGEYMHNNVGLELVLSPLGGEYMHQNIGFQVILSPLGGDYMHQYVFVGVPVPHLWFAWLDHGFVEDHVWIYGQGLGTVMTEYHASIRVIDSNTDLEQAMSVFDWSTVAASVDAYGEDRQIYHGTDGVDPFVNIEVTIIEVTIPTGIATPEAVVDYFLARTDGGVSNQLPWLLYPLIPMPMTVGQGMTRSSAALRVSTGQEPADPIPTLLAAFAPQQLTALGGMLERAPGTVVSARSTFTLGNVGEAADLEDPVGTPVPLAARWRGLEATITPRPDLGTGVSLWEPVSGSENAWRLVTGSEPYVDEAYAVMSRADRIGRPAMLFPGDAWAELTEPLPDNATWPQFTVAMVAVLHPSAGTPDAALDDGTNLLSATAIFSTVLDTAQPADTYPLSLILDGAQVTAKFGVSRNNFLSVSIPGDYLGQRPVILVFSTGARSATSASTEPPVGRLSLLADTLTTVSGSHLRLATESRLYLGRDPAPEHVTRMEILDIAVGERLTPAQEVALIAALDGAYGVSGA